jgi:hypothetical protein
VLDMGDVEAARLQEIRAVQGQSMAQIKMRLISAWNQS